MATSSGLLLWSSDLADLAFALLASGAEHVERNKKQNDAAGYAERHSGEFKKH